jgi:acetyl-CoA synthetase
MFRIDWQKDELYASRFPNVSSITGDRARHDPEGYCWFVGRTDDVIHTAGHLVGLLEVKSVPIDHSAVAQARVMGKADLVARKLVKALVSLKDGLEPWEELRHQIQESVMKGLSSAAARREMGFIPALPNPRSGEFMRRLLEANELGLPPGETSTMEGD